MFEELFPFDFYKKLKMAPLNKINEIRIRLSKRIVIIIGNKSYYLSNEGLTGNIDKAVIADKFLIDEIVRKSCENSVYAFASQIKQGFITVKGGYRVGLSGEGVYENDKLKTLKNINSLTVRIPREIVGCSRGVLQYLFENSFLNTLIISPPGCGKTTFIRDLIYQLSEKNYCYNILLVDERFEIANCFNGCATLNVGNFCDILSGVSKNYAFENGIRSLRPDIIATDELSGKSDFESVIYACSSGVKIIASIHARSLDDLKNKQDFEDLLKNKIFQRFVILSSRDGPGTVEGVYDENLRCINF